MPSTRPRARSVERAVVVGGALLALAGCGGRHEEHAAALPVVQTSLARQGVIHPSEQLAGIVAPYLNVAIQSSLSEPADSVYVQEGDRVTRGEVLAQLDTADLRAALEADLATAASNHANTSHDVYQGNLSISQGVDSLRGAQAAVSQARENLLRDQTDLKRYQQLVANGYIAEQQVAQQATTVRDDEQALQSAVASLASARSNVAANGTLASNGLQATTIAQSRATEQVALAQAQQERVQIEKATIVSPIDGVVVNRNLNPGEYPGSRQLFTLQQVDPIYAVLRGSGSQIAELATGGSATIVASDLHGRRLSGTVVGVLNQIAPGSTDFQVKVLLRNPDGKLRPGMTVAAKVGLPPVSGLRIPSTAFTDDSRSAVLVVAEDGTVKTTRVTELGDDGTTSVVSGLQAGTRVISDGQTSVGDGEKVATR
ncbi:MAG: efflux RND transporter periplasmic adaptor subunit [Candidatus Baltobacteraceae bacterium]